MVVAMTIYILAAVLLLLALMRVASKPIPKMRRER